MLRRNLKNKMENEDQVVQVIKINNTLEDWKIRVSQWDKFLDGKKHKYSLKKVVMNRSKAQNIMHRQYNSLEFLNQDQDCIYKYIILLKLGTA